MDERSDSELVFAVLAGDADAFASLVDRHEGRARALAWRLLRDEQDAADVLQEAVLQAYLGLEHLRDSTRFGSWLSGITANLARMRLRARQRVPRGVQRADLAGAVDVAADVERSTLVRGAMGELTKAEQATVLMHDVAGLTSVEIAARRGETSGAVRVRLHRARSKLRRHFAALSPNGRGEPVIDVDLRDVVVRVTEEGGTPALASEMRILLLQERDGGRVLPIWVGASDGDMLALHLGGEAVPRPLTADLMARLIQAAGARVDGVTVNSLRDNTFYAVVRLLDQSGTTHEADARPSDAINLAVRVGAPISVDRTLFEQAALPGGTAEDLEREHVRVAEREGRQPPPAGAWTSLSPHLVRTVGSFQYWGRSEQEGD